MNEQAPSALAHKVIVVILYRLGFCFICLKREGKEGRKSGQEGDTQEARLGQTALQFSGLALWGGRKPRRLL